MAFWKFQQPQVTVVEQYASSSSSAFSSTSVTPGASGSWGSWTLIDGAAAERDAYWVRMGWAGISSSGNDRRMLMDVGIYNGSTYHSQVVATIGSTQVVSGFWSANTGMPPLTLPIFVKAGYRVAMRAMFHTTSPPTITPVYCDTFGAQDFYGHSGGHAMDSVGVDETNVKGVPVPVGSSGSWGAWTALDSSTDNPYIGVVPFFGLNGATAYSTTGYIRCQIGDGTNILIDGLRLYVTTTEYVSVQRPGPLWFPNAIPAGSSLQVRLLTTTSGTFEDIDVTLGMIRR